MSSLRRRGISPLPRRESARVAAVDGARWLVWAALAAALLAQARVPGPEAPLDWARAPGGCALAAAPAPIAACPCRALPAVARRLRGLPLALNGAGPRDLELLPGVGPVRARAIAADRAERGPFPSVAALERVRGIGPLTAAALGPALFVGGVDPACSLRLD